MRSTEVEIISLPTNNNFYPPHSVFPHAAFYMILKLRRIFGKISSDGREKVGKLSNEGKLG
jgi:hypothetical protein